MVGGACEAAGQVFPSAPEYPGYSGVQVSAGLVAVVAADDCGGATLVHL